MGDIFELIFYSFGITILIITLILSLPRKRSLLVTIASFVMVLATLVAIDHFLGTTILANPPVPLGLAFMPLMIFLFKGNIFEKFFALFMQIFFSTAIGLFTGMAYGFFIEYGTPQIFIMVILTVFLLYALYIILIFKFGKKVLNLLFGSGSKSEWVLYMTSAAILHIMLFILRKIHAQNNIIHFVALIFLVWSFGILCFAIINTHKKQTKV